MSVPQLNKPQTPNHIPSVVHSGRVGSRSPLFLPSSCIASILETRGGNFARERLMKRATSTGCCIVIVPFIYLIMERECAIDMQEAEISVQMNSPSFQLTRASCFARCLLACFAISSSLGFCSWDFSNNLENKAASLPPSLPLNSPPLPGRNTKFPLCCYSTLERKSLVCCSDFNSLLALSLFKLLRIQSVILPVRDE